MTMQEIAGLILQHADEYAVESEEEIPNGDGTFSIKKCKKIDVTVDLIIEFCKKHNLPLPDEMLYWEDGNDSNDSSL